MTKLELRFEEDTKGPIGVSIYAKAKPGKNVTENENAMLGFISQGAVILILEFYKAMGQSGTMTNTVCGWTKEDWERFGVTINVDKEKLLKYL